MMRFGNENDGVYSGGTSISAKQYYIIARDDASDEIKNMADIPKP